MILQVVCDSLWPCGVQSLTGFGGLHEVAVGLGSHDSGDDDDDDGGDDDDDEDDGDGSMMLACSSICRLGSCFLWKVYLRLSLPSCHCCLVSCVVSQTA